MRVAIVGGGLAGCALAYVLKVRGAEPVIVEAADRLASGASGNRIGLYNPRFTAELGPQGAFYSKAFFRALDVFGRLDEIDWVPCGALHLITDEKKARRFSKTCESWGWAQEDMRLVDAREASRIAGVEITHDALYLRRSGSVCPEKLCRAYADGVDVHLNVRAESLAQVKTDFGADAVVAANGLGALAFSACTDLPLRAVRGQVTLVAGGGALDGLASHLCYGGYVSRAVDGVHVVGSTFQPWLDHCDLLEEDDLDNLAKLKEAVPVLAGAEFEVIGARAAVRCTVKDHFPVIGALDAAAGYYVSAGHGSHGILSSLEGAHILAGMILGEQGDWPSALLVALSPGRFSTIC
ncbi:MAG: FAD-dependent 5-carboxymethylaminomethyl-2-thiouridine(34) oxidoreductase MnmC [Alphaproteobacteria bacterium]|nr:FAD-dependent 5-carboxymethylaminomethyl-2-thiouridine(34) oxidoreductase MnmC [Alphaproteobacteria bacterium]